MGKMREAFAMRYVAVCGGCENCGKYIANPTPSNFAHTKGKNRLTKQEKFTEFVFVCEELHRYQHTRANNLKSNECVKKFLSKYGKDGKDPKPFWGEFIYE